MKVDIWTDLRYGTKHLLVLVWLGLHGISACTPRNPEDTGQGSKTSRSTTLATTRRFLSLAAAGDSAGLAVTAAPKVVKAVLLNHRAGRAEHLHAAAETNRRTRVTPYQDGADVTFGYELHGTQYQAFVTLMLEGEQLMVTAYGLPAKID